MNKDLLRKSLKIILENRLLFISFGVTILLLGVIAYRFWPTNPAKDYQKIEKIYSDFEKSEDPKLLSTLHSLVVHYPTLYSQYKEQISQKLLLKDKVPPPYFTPQAQLPYFASFNKASLLLAQNNLQEALKESSSLKAQILQEQTFEKEKLLFACNLLRIALLQKELKLINEEKSSLHELEELLKTDKLLAHQLNTTFQVNKITLQDYLASIKAEN